MNKKHVKLAKEAAKSLPHVVYVNPELKLGKGIIQQIKEAKEEDFIQGDLINEKTLKQLLRDLYIIK